VPRCEDTIRIRGSGRPGITSVTSGSTHTSISTWWSFRASEYGNRSGRVEDPSVRCSRRCPCSRRSGSAYPNEQDLNRLPPAAPEGHTRAVQAEGRGTPSARLNRARPSAGILADVSAFEASTCEPPRRRPAEPRSARLVRARPSAGTLADLSAFEASTCEPSRRRAEGPRVRVSSAPARPFSRRPDAGYP